jgi:hypothetical protein
MSKVKFDFDSFFLSTKVSIPELGEKLRMEYRTLYPMIKRGTVKLSFLKNLESIFGDCTEFIINENQLA